MTCCSSVSTETAQAERGEWCSAETNSGELRTWHLSICAFINVSWDSCKINKWSLTDSMSFTSDDTSKQFIDNGGRRDNSLIGYVARYGLGRHLKENVQNILYVVEIFIFALSLDKPRGVTVIYIYKTLLRIMAHYSHVIYACYQNML